MSQPTSIAEWLTTVGMLEYATRFAENDIDVSVLGQLTDRDLKELGVSLGHRRKLLANIAELSASGARPMATAPAPRGYAQRLSIMFCDLVGSTALSTRLDVEDLRAVVAVYHRCCAETIEREGGFMAKYMGDGVLAYFGYPQASEHDAERAVRAGLALVEAVPGLESPPTCRSGPSRDRHRGRGGRRPIGQRRGARAGGRWRDPEPYRHAAGAGRARLRGHRVRHPRPDWRPVRIPRTVALKGFDRDMQAWQVLGSAAAESRFEALRATGTPLVDRDHETSLLLSRWGRVRRERAVSCCRRERPASASRA